MPFSIRLRLSIMMFLNYVIWGSWYVTITTYLTNTLHFTGTQAGAVFGTASIAAIISPFIVGLVADRFFATERVLAGSALSGGYSAVSRKPSHYVPRGLRPDAGLLPLL